MGDVTLCPFCGAYSTRSCELLEDTGCCPWEEAEEEWLRLVEEIFDEGADRHD